MLWTNLISDVQWSFAHSLNGWTDGELALQWMIKDFDEQMKEKADGCTHVLLMDGHSSHYTLELLAYAHENNNHHHPQWPHCFIVPAWFIWPSFKSSDHLWPQSWSYLLSQPSHAKQHMDMVTHVIGANKLNNHQSLLIIQSLSPFLYLHC
jgi:hypothetical protein